MFLLLIVVEINEVFYSSELFWSDRGAEPGVYRAALSGDDVTWLVRRSVRRVTALALDAPAGRLYFIDPYRSVLESVALDGSDRAVVAEFQQRGVNKVCFNLASR